MFIVGHDMDLVVFLVFELAVFLKSCNSPILYISFLTWTFSFLLEKSGANIALESKLSKSGPVFSK